MSNRRGRMKWGLLQSACLPPQQSGDFRNLHCKRFRYPMDLSRCRACHLLFLYQGAWRFHSKWCWIWCFAQSETKKKSLPCPVKWGKTKSYWAFHWPFSIRWKSSHFLSHPIQLSPLFVAETFGLPVPMEGIRGPTCLKMAQVHLTLSEQYHHHYRGCYSM